MSNPEKHTEGLWWEFLTALLDAEARSSESPYGAHDVAEIATDPYRIDVSDEVRRGKGFLRGTKKELRQRTEALREAVEAYDEAADS